MRKADIYGVAIKILGLYLLVSFLEKAFEIGIYAYGYLGFQEVQGLSLSAHLITLVITGLVLLTAFFIAWMFIFKTKWVVAKICSQSDFEENATLFLDTKVIYELSIIITGLVLIVWTLPDFIFRCFAYLTQLKHGEAVQVRDYNFLVTSVFKLLIGILAILLAKSISSRLAKDKIS